MGEKWDNSKCIELQLQINSLDQEANEQDANCNTLKGQIEVKQRDLDNKPSIIQDLVQKLYNIENEIQGLASEKSYLDSSDPNYDTKIRNIDTLIKEKRATQQNLDRDKTKHENEKDALSRRVSDLTFQLKLEAGGRDRKLRDKGHKELLYSNHC